MKRHLRIAQWTERRFAILPAKLLGASGTALWTLRVGPGDETVGLRTGRDITPPASIADAPARSGAATGMASFPPVLPLVSRIGCGRTLTTASPPENCPLIARRGGLIRRSAFVSSRIEA